MIPRVLYANTVKEEKDVAPSFWRTALTSLRDRQKLFAQKGLGVFTDGIRQA